MSASVGTAPATGVRARRPCGGGRGGEHGAGRAGEQREGEHDPLEHDPSPRARTPRTALGARGRTMEAP